MTTNKAGFLDRDRASYIGPTHEGVGCTGAKGACQFLIDEGATYLAWGAKPNTPEDLRVLHLLPALRQLKKPALPDYLAQARALWLLAMPAPMLAALSDPSSLPPALRTLQLDFDPRYLERGPKPLRWPEFELPGLRGLFCVGPSESSHQWIELGLEPERVPGLEFIGSEVDPDGRVLEALAGLTSLRHVELEDIGNHDGVFARVPETLEALSLRTSGRKFRLDELDRLKRLRGLQLNAIRTEVDCRLIAGLPALEQLNLLNSRKLTHVEALLEAPKLRWLFVLDCGRPFKKELKARFEAHGFEGLDIAFA